MDSLPSLNVERGLRPVSASGLVVHDFHLGIMVNR